MTLNANDEDVLSGMTNWAKVGDRVIDRERSIWRVTKVYNQPITLKRYCSLRCENPGPGLLGLRIGDLSSMAESYLEPAGE